MAKQKEVMGEENPGFTLWTSAHGFHHFTLSNRKGWKCVWAFILLVLVISLVCCITYYFYYVFSTAVYSRNFLTHFENLKQLGFLCKNWGNELQAKLVTLIYSRTWPTTIICERQAFTLNRINSVPSLTISHASLLSWSLAPELADPETYSTHFRIPNLEAEIEKILGRSEYSGNVNKLLLAMAPNCTQFILECKYGTCYSTKSASLKHKVTVAGEGSGISVTTMHDSGNPFDRTFASSELFGSSGVNFAIVDGYSTIEASLRGRGQFIQPGKLATIGISRSYVDNSDLEFSAIGRMKCTPPGTTDSTLVDPDLIFGLPPNFGYTKDSCSSQVKKETLARDILGCSFMNSEQMPRCSPQQSAVYYRSFIDLNQTSIDRISTVQISDPNLQGRLGKECLQDCVQDRYSLSQSFSDFSDNLKADLVSKINAAGAPTSTTNIVILKFYLNSLEFNKIHNFPQHGLQFVAEVGGLMAFFLGLSIVSILECICYLFTWCVNKCDGDSEEEERLRQIWKDGMNEVHPDQREQERAQRQSQFNQMEQRLRQMDMYERR